MYTFRKYVEGIAIHNDDSGVSRLLSEAETARLLVEFPALNDNQTAAYHIDALPAHLNDIRV